MVDAEREFWDEHAQQQFIAGWKPSADENVDHIMAALGDVRGQRILDLGSGAGDLTLRLVDAGARVTALDVSAGQIELARALIGQLRPEAEIEFVVAPVETTGLQSDSYDMVVGKWILHHVDVPNALAETRRLLRPLGRAIFFENHDRNRLLALSRAHVAGRFGVSRFGTPTEHPLSRSDMELVKRTFGGVELEYPEFYCVRMVSSRVLRYHGHAIATRVDKLLWRLKWLRPFSWHVLIKVVKQPT
jgi:ubiquinone/menaquinone biosynthesis C-methylase UbiE